ncbi:MAG TPA: prepilin-type N-terminal cleavage/methylation domain-containing protein, partial [Pirellulaceae bacterium]|nr:prepilin-type N-terminal cleavage/methylation domain-containing protein [Pirellulaceae bacterium]
MATAAVCRPGAHSRSLSRWERVSRPSRRAFTLLELLVAMALTLLLVYAMAEFYSYVGDTVRDGRAIVEMGSDIRNAVR